MDFFNVFAMFEVKLLKSVNEDQDLIGQHRPHQHPRHGSCLEVQEPLDQHLPSLDPHLQVDILRPRSNDSMMNVFGCMEFASCLVRTCPTSPCSETRTMMSCNLFHLITMFWALTRPTLEPHLSRCLRQWKAIGSASTFWSLRLRTKSLFLQSSIASRSTCSARSSLLTLLA